MTGRPASADLLALEAAGIEIVPDETLRAFPQGPIVITAVQAARLLAAVGVDDGLLGADVDVLAPMPEGTPPTSYLVAAWVSAHPSPAAGAAREWMGERDWRRAAEVRFPVAVLMMFVAEMARAADVELPAAADAIDLGGLIASGSGLMRTAGPAAPASGPCSAVTGFVAAAIGGLFNALRITPSSGTGIFDILGGVLASIWNTALGLAHGVVQGLVDTITAPVFEAIRLGVGALGVATLVVSYFNDQTLTVTSEPGGPYRFAIGAEADIAGQFVARAKELTGDWPPALVDCAKVAGAPLPKLITAGSVASWTVAGTPGMIAAGSMAEPVRADLTAHLAFVTGRESEEQAAGQPTSGTAIARVRIQRPEIDTFLQFARDQVRGAQSSLLARVPAGPARDAAAATFAAVIDPTVARIEGEIAGSAAGVFTLSGERTITVGFHIPPDTTTTATAPPGTVAVDDFCTQYRDLIAWTRVNQPGDPVPWALEIVRRLSAMRPSAPADLVDEVDVMLGVYTAVAESADVVILSQRALPLGTASATTAAACGLTASG